MSEHQWKRSHRGLRAPRHIRGRKWGPCMNRACGRTAALTVAGSGKWAGRYFEVCRPCRSLVLRNGRPQTADDSRHLTDAEAASILERIRSGETWAAMSEEFGMERSNLRRAVIRWIDRSGA